MRKAVAILAFVAAAALCASAADAAAILGKKGLLYKLCCNGIMYYGRQSDFESAEMTIDIVKNGAIATGDVFAQPQRTGVLWDAYLIKLRTPVKSKYILFFLSACLEKAIKDKFGYDDKRIWEKVRQLLFYLPVSANGDPDYAYMEKYMLTLERRMKKFVDLLLSVMG